MNSKLVFINLCLFTAVLVIDVNTDTVKGLLLGCMIDNNNDYNKHDRVIKTNPIRPPCEKLVVRKDIKCLSKGELRNFTEVIRILYERGVVEKYAKIHNDYWPATHKFQEAIHWHRWWYNKFEREMWKINPYVILPYWEIYTQFAEPEKSYVYDICGHGGKAPDYCVRDREFAKQMQMLTYPDRHCLRRQWYKNGTEAPWESPEWATSIIQQGPNSVLLTNAYEVFKTYATTREEKIRLRNMLADYLFPIDSTDPSRKPFFQMSAYFANTAHFKVHLSNGGKTGDLSYNWAPVDILFILFHIYIIENAFLFKWQLLSDENLVSESYAFGLRLDTETGQITISDLDDKLNYFSNITIRETWQMGYGELCSIPDVFVKPINEIMRKEKRQLPKLYYRLKEAMSNDSFQMYYPKFALQPEKVTYWDYELPRVRDCNKNCELMPRAIFFNSTYEGRALLERFGASDGTVDIAPLALQVEQDYYDYMDVMDKSGYCSPYVPYDWSKKSTNSESSEH